jgi:hypothetical protein
MFERRPPSNKVSSSTVGVVPLRNRACHLPCGGSPPIYVGFSSFFLVPVKPSSMCSPFFVPLQQPTSIMFNPSSTTNHHSHLARIKHVVGLSNHNPTSLTTRLKLCGYEKGHHRSHRHRKKCNVWKLFVFLLSLCLLCSIVFVWSFIVLYCVIVFLLSLFLSLPSLCLMKSPKNVWMQ